jgi:hypothetical protein
MQPTANASADWGVKFFYTSTSSHPIEIKIEKDNTIIFYYFNGVWTS